ncbi:cocaine esterase-like [Clavelina lepadiformis]
MSECPIVQTVNGKVKGKACLKAKPNESNQVFRYASIPFAKPPLGELRFEPPERSEPWQGILDGTKMSPRPLQDEAFEEELYGNLPLLNQFEENLSDFSEDCLYLTVYTSNPSATANMPVIVWIPGGAFLVGGGSLRDGQVLCGLHDLVLVVPNYRLSLYGFFTTGKNTKYPGNMGLLDQIMAFEWTRDNIQKFGGDPNNITVAGQSAGAVSVGLHMISPMSQRLFHKAILCSCAATSPCLLKDNYSEILKLHLEALGVKETEPSAIAAKLKSISAEEIREKTKHLHILQSFFVSVDGQFLKTLPSKPNFAPEFLAPVPILLGCTSSEGAGMLKDAFSVIFPSAHSEEEWSDEAKKALLTIKPSLNDKELENVVERLNAIYAKSFPGEDAHNPQRKISALASDPEFLFPAIELASLQSDRGHGSFLYQMTQKLKCFHDDEYAIETRKKDDFCECDHCDCLLFTFGISLANGKKRKQCKFTGEEEKLARIWMTYLSNFAAYGNPNKGEAVEMQWPQYDVKSRRHLVVRVPLAEDNHLVHDRYQWWKSFNDDDFGN